MQTQGIERKGEIGRRRENRINENSDTKVDREEQEVREETVVTSVAVQYLKDGPLKMQ